MFATRLRQERLRRHLSQETLAEAVGVSARTISRWEQGEGIPQPILRLQLSRYFELSPEALFEESLALSSLVQKDAEEPNFELAAPALPENTSRETAASGGISQDTKGRGRSSSKRLFRRRTILLGLGVLGLLVLGIGEFFVVFHPLAALSGAEPHMTAAPIRLTAMANHTATAVASKNNSGTYICWGANVHLPAQCMDLKDDHFTTNQPVYLWSSRTGNGLGWNISLRGTVTSTKPFTVSSLSTRYHGDTVAYFEKTTGAGHNGCLGVNPHGGLAWEPCGHADTYWVISKYGDLVNVSLSNSVGTPIVANVCDSRNGGSIRLGFQDKPNRCLGHWTFL